MDVVVVGDDVQDIGGRSGDRGCPESGGESVVDAFVAVEVAENRGGPVGIRLVLFWVGVVVEVDVFAPADVFRVLEDLGKVRPDTGLDLVVAHDVGEAGVRGWREMVAVSVSDILCILGLGLLTKDCARDYAPPAQESL